MHMELRPALIIVLVDEMGDASSKKTKLLELKSSFCDSFLSTQNKAAS